MKSRAELQDWMRDGCPLPPEVGPLGTVLCEGYVMAVFNHGAGQWGIAASCRNSGDRTELEGIILTDDGQIAGNVIIANKALEWVLAHAIESGMEEGPAVMAYGNSMNWDRVSEWAIRVIGAGRIPGVEGFSDAERAARPPEPPVRGIWLRPTPTQRTRSF